MNQGDVFVLLLIQVGPDLLKLLVEDILEIGALRIGGDVAQIEVDEQFRRPYW